MRELDKQTIVPIPSSNRSFISQCYAGKSGRAVVKKEPTRPSPPLCHYLCMHDFIYSVSVCFALNLFPAPLDGKLVFPQLPSAFVFNSKNETCLMSGRSSRSLFVLLGTRSNRVCALGQVK